MMLWYMSICHNKDITNNVIFAFRMSLLSERHLMTVVTNMHKPYFHLQDICHHVMVMKVSCQSYAHPFK